MANCEVMLKGREDIAEGTMAFRFEKPVGFSFSPGQAVTVSLNNPPAEPNSASRTFSLVSAPFEQELMVATRMRESVFKRTRHCSLQFVQHGITMPWYCGISRTRESANDELARDSAG